LIGADVVVIVPEVGFEACTLGNATNAMLNRAKTQTRVINTPNEFSARQEISLENSEVAGALLLFLIIVLTRQLAWFRFAFGFIGKQLFWSGE